MRLFSDAERKALTRDVAPRTILRPGATSWAQSAAQTLRLPPLASPRAIHPRVRTLLRIIREGGVDEGTSLELLASAVGLSPSRLMHVFTSSLGIPLRPLREMRCAR